MEFIRQDDATDPEHGACSDRTQPRLGPHPELLTFRCLQCGHVVTIAADEER
jgi:hypothetical protein